ncbi:ABC transporter substrate-binding protein [Aeromicrobium duanguangcaii]|uniref:ABC transporter substrate-binding protein n=1 Tax=Aeromicrobium duanguangcaii TaxID=2968086 RepID=A0ABY5KJG9_9ACTN|nr:ABC transporter substrate-binding protein [Aeromicrobium duanguangcaii]MCD9154442.1 ABC transporter substrate-binding protein [Aeromicrobium duanguangcaii]UUI68498.1 ABC transporter substrate-binding protein [Aeromicrobium duanguangcaii]
MALASTLLAGCFGGGDDSSDEKTASSQSPKTSADTSLPLADVHPADDADVREGGTLRMGVASFPATFNPVHTDGVASTAPQILAPTLGSAIRVKDDGSWAVDPDYATDVDIVDRSPLTVRVELNRKAVWQGGTPITAADMVSFVDAMQDDDYAAARVPAVDAIDTVRADGDFAYEVVFDEPTADWPAAVYPTLPKAYTRSVKTFNRGLTAKAPSANGPFIVSGIERKTGTITLERNPRWWGAPPKLDSIVWRIGADDVLAAAHVAGELEAAPVTPANRKALADTDLRASLGSEWSQLTINGGNGPLADADVRRAVMLAVDSAAVVKDTSKRYGVTTVPMSSVVLLPGQVGDPRTKPLARNVDRATALLARAGWKREGGKGLVRRKGRPLTLTLPVPETRSGAVERARTIAKDLAEVGVQVKVKQVPGATFFEKVVIPLDFDLTTFTWSVEPFGLGEVKRLFTPIDSPLNFTGKSSKATAKAFDAAIEQLDQKKRAAAIAKVDKVTRAQASIMPLAVVPEVLAVDPEVRNFGPAALADLDWTRVGFAEDLD